MTGMGGEAHPMKSRLRVACVISTLQAGGAERVMAQLCNDLAARGHDVTLVTFAPADEAPFYELSGAVRLIQLGSAARQSPLDRLVRLGRLMAALRRTIASCRPDVAI